MRIRCTQSRHTACSRGFRPSPAFPRASGQASLELVGTLPLLVLGALACVQAFLIALSAIYADAAAAAAARSPQLAAAGLPIPEAWRHGAQVQRTGSRATVALRPPSVVPHLRMPQVSGEARVPS